MDSESPEMSSPPQDLEAAGGEGADKKEKLNPKEKVIRSLRDGLSIFEADVQAKPDDEKATQETKSQLAEIAEAKRKLEDLINGGTGTEKIKLLGPRGGLLREYDEGIPIIEMHNHLVKKAASLPRNSPEARQINEIIEILFKRKNTKDYMDYPWKTYPRYMTARVKIELERIKTDGRSTGDQEEDLGLAWEAVDKRRELFAPSQGKPPPVEEQRFTVALVNIDDDAKKVAREEAGEYVREQTVVKQRWNPLEWMRAIVFRRGEEYFKHRQTSRVQIAQVEAGQYFCGIDAATGAAREMVGGRQRMVEQGTASAERFALAAEGKTEIHHGEEMQSLASQEAGKQVSALITRFAKGEITLEQFGTEKDALIQALRKNPDIAPYIQDAKFIGDNISEVAQKIKLSSERGELGLENLDRMLDIQLGRVKMAAQTEADYSRIERIMNRLQSNRFTGFLANPLAIGLAFGLASSASAALGFGARWATGIGLAGAPIGAVFNALNRWVDLKRDRELEERDAAYQREGKDQRRQRLDEFKINIKEGGGRVSAKDLLGEIQRLSSVDLSTESARGDLLAKVAEINARINYGIDNGVDLMTFEERFSTESEKLKLVLAQIEALEKLKALEGYRKATKKQKEEIDKKIKGEVEAKTGEFWQGFKETKEDQERRFNRFRWGQTGQAFVFGLVTGFGGGILGQHGGELIRRGLGHVPTRTILEMIASGRPVAEWFGGGVRRAAGFAVDQTRDAFANPDRLYKGAVWINQDLRIDVDPVIHDGVRNITFHDGAGALIPTGPVRLTPEGTIIMSGNIPDSLKSILGGMESRITHNPILNIRDDLREWFSTPTRHDTFQFGDLTVDINPTQKLEAAADGVRFFQGSMTLYEGTPNALRIHGILREMGGNPIFDIDTAHPGNVSLTPQQLETLRSALPRDGWQVTIDHVDAIPSKGTVLDALLERPGALKAQGIVETDQFQKTWNFHVLRPDIVSETGMHTHNELTLHLGGQYGVLTEAGEVIRTGVGNPGDLNFGGEISGQLIDSHLIGVPPQADQILNSFLERNGPLNPSDMLFVVDLTDGRQIMVAADSLGNAHLPDALYDKATGALRGIKSIAAAYLQRPDGTLISAGEVLENGQIPDGSVVHSLASEKFASILPPPAPPTPPHDIYHFTPPDAVEFTPPPPQTVEDFRPIYTTPWGRRHPLGPRKKEGRPTLVPAKEKPKPEPSTTASFKEKPEPETSSMDVMPAWFKPWFIKERNRDLDKIGSEVSALDRKRKELQGLPESAERNRELEKINEQEARLVQKPLEDGKVYPLKDVFRDIVGGIYRGGDYFVENPPESVQLTPDQMKALELRLPFFVNIRQNPDSTFSFETNREVVPFVWALLHRDQRYANGERRTGGDSGLLALAAISSGNPENQAKLYKTYSSVILSMHKNNPALLADWIEAQKGTEGADSAIFLQQNDLTIIDGKLQPEPEEQRLVILGKDEEFQAIWQKRIEELERVLASDQLQTHHLRWIEFLSHSVDVAGLTQIIKTQQSAPPAAQPSTPPQT